MGDKCKVILNPNTIVRDECLRQIDLLDGICPLMFLNTNGEDCTCPCSALINNKECVYGLFVKKELI